MDDGLFFLVALLFLAGMLFYSSRKRKRVAEDLKSKVVKGAYVMLTSGIFGTVTEVKDDRIKLETAPGQVLTVARGAVRSIEQSPKPKSTAKAATAAKSSSVGKPNTKKK
jgi:preprotein translocase subunit YajC